MDYIVKKNAKKQYQMKRLRGNRRSCIGNGIRIENFDNDDVVNLNVKQGAQRRVLHKSMSVIMKKPNDSHVFTGDSKHLL